MVTYESIDLKKKEFKKHDISCIFVMQNNKKEKDMQFELQAKVVINVESSNILGITTAFLKSLAPIFASMVSMVMFHYRDEYEKKKAIFQAYFL